MKIHFYLDRRKGKTQMLPVFLQCWYKGQLLRVFTGEHCSLEDWDFMRERIKSDRNSAAEINRLFQSMEEEVLTLVRETKTARRIVNINFLKDNLTFLNGKERNFFSLWEEFIRIGHSDKRWGEGMVRRLDILRMHLKNLDKKYKIGFNTINEKFYKAFLKYHQQQGLKISYAVRNLELFRWFMNWASMAGHNHNMAYKKFKPPAEEKKNYEGLYLTESELIDFCKIETDRPTLKIVKDIFCFACFTGLRYSDLMKLKNKNFTGKKLIIGRPKPPVTIEIPLTEQTQNILSKYHPGSNGTIFPVLPIQEFNRHLKVLGEMAGIDAPGLQNKVKGKNRDITSGRKWERISSGFARRTFINLGVKRGIGLEVMCEFTGNLPGTIKNYYKIKSDRKKAEIEKLNMLI